MANFSKALEHLKQGEPICRAGWHKTGMFLKLITIDEMYPMTLPFIYLVIDIGMRVPWVASQTDLLADDWIVFGDQERAV